MGITNILTLLGGVAFFLFGMSVMGGGLKRVGGRKMEMVLYRLSGTPIKGLALGAGVTAVIQSSSATSVMVVGFVNSNMMKVKQAISVVMGAIIGTSVTGWVICLSEIGSGASGVLSLFSTENLALICGLIGIILYMFCKGEGRKSVGMILLGFAVLMYGMHIMSGSVSALKDNPAFIGILTGFSSPLLGILIGLVFTAILQSASAAVGILQALSVSGAISFGVALPVLIGISIGATVPVLLSAIGSNSNARRVAWSYMTVDVLGAIPFCIVFYGLYAIMRWDIMDFTMNSVSIAMANTLYRVIICFIVLPFIGYVEKLLQKVIADKNTDEELSEVESLEERFLEYPALAVEHCKEVVASMGEKTRKCVKHTMDLFDNYSQEAFDEICKEEGILDKYEDALETYLVKLTSRELTGELNNSVSKFLHAISDFERIGDHARNVAESIKEKVEKGYEFSEQASAELDVLVKAICKIVDLSVESFANNDTALADHVEPLEEVIDDLCDQIKHNHNTRVKCGECTWDKGFIFNDILTDLERISDHCSNVGVMLIEIEEGVMEIHAYSALLKEEDENFNRLYAEYASEYAVEVLP